MQLHGVTLSFHRQVYDASREFVWPNVVMAVSSESYPRFVCAFKSACKASLALRTESMGQGWRKLVACVLLTFSVEASHAHPHIWVTMRCKIIFGVDGSIAGVRYAWSFDEMSSAFITLGTEDKQKGISAEQLASLAAAHVVSLKSSDYFTRATVNGVKQRIELAADYRLESGDGGLTLHFTLPFRPPLTANTLELEVYDPSYFVDIRFAEQAPVELVNPPSDCKFAITRQTWTQVAGKIVVTCP